jgi:hypothetical protein
MMDMKVYPIEPRRRVRAELAADNYQLEEQSIDEKRASVKCVRVVPVIIVVIAYGYSYRCWLSAC